MGQGCVTHSNVRWDRKRRHALSACFFQKEMEKRTESGLDNDWKLSVYCSFLSELKEYKIKDGNLVRRSHFILVMSVVC